jgi:hypothetical protein
MGLMTWEVEFAPSGTEIAEIPGWAPAVKEAPALDRIIGEYADRYVAWAGCGRQLPSLPGVTPISDGDCCDYTKKWIAPAAGLTREVDVGIFAGIPRYRAHRDVNDGIQAQLPAALTSYTAQFLFVLKDLAAASGLFCLGTALASRAFLYVDTSGRLRHQHGSSDEQFGSGVLAVNVPYACIISFDGTSRAFRIYINQVDTPYLAWTKTNGAPASTNARYLSAGAGENPANAELIPYGILPFALHLDPDGLRDAMTGLVGIGTL